MPIPNMVWQFPQSSFESMHNDCFFNHYDWKLTIISITVRGDLETGIWMSYVCREQLPKRSILWRGPEARLIKLSVVQHLGKRASSRLLRFFWIWLLLLSYSDQWLADGDRLSAEGYCHWGIFLICVINGYGERRLPANEQHIKKTESDEAQVLVVGLFRSAPVR